MQKLFSSYKNFQLILGCIKFPEHYFSEWLESIRGDCWKMVKKILGVVAVDAAAVAVGGDDDVVGGGSGGNGGSVILE